MNKNPQQREKTKDKIFESFFWEYKKLPLKQVTVSAIAKRAEINRSTFYEYFADVYDLLDQAEDLLLSEILFHAQFLENFSNEERVIALPEFGEKILNKYGKRLAILLQRQDSGFSFKLVNTMKPVMKSFLKMDVNDEKTELLVSFLLAGITGYITTLYQKEENINVSENVKTLQNMMFASINSVYN